MSTQRICLAPDDARTLGHLIALWREVNDVPGRELGTELGLDKHAVSRIEHGLSPGGKAPLNISTAIIVAEHIGLDLNGMCFDWKGYRVSITRIAC